jgi:hypothetical protein
LNLDIYRDEDKENFFAVFKKPIIASLLVIPLLFLITDHISAMLISVVFSGTIAYFISCKLRKKIVTTVLIVIIISITHMIIQSNIIIFGKNVEILELMTLSVGALGVYLLMLTLFLIPLSLVTWYIASRFRNVKERKDPLLSLERSCDL